MRWPRVCYLWMIGILIVLYICSVFDSVHHKVHRRPKNRRVFVETPSAIPVVMTSTLTTTSPRPLYQQSIRSSTSRHVRGKSDFAQFAKKNAEKARTIGGIEEEEFGDLKRFDTSMAPETVAPNSAPFPTKDMTSSSTIFSNIFGSWYPRGTQTYYGFNITGDAERRYPIISEENVRPGEDPIEVEKERSRAELAREPLRIISELDSVAVCVRAPKNSPFKVSRKKDFDREGTCGFLPANAHDETHSAEVAEALNAWGLSNPFTIIWTENPSVFSTLSLKKDEDYTPEEDSTDILDEKAFDVIDSSTFSKPSHGCRVLQTNGYAPLETLHPLSPLQKFKGKFTVALVDLRQWREGHYRRILRHRCMRQRGSAPSRLRGRGELSLPMFYWMWKEKKRRFRNCQWFMKVDTDTFVHWAALHRELNSMDSKLSLYVGTPLTFSTTHYNLSRPVEQFLYHIGGPGYVFSQGLMENMRLNACFQAMATEPVLLVHDDAGTGYCAMLYASKAISDGNNENGGEEVERVDHVSAFAGTKITHIASFLRSSISNSDCAKCAVAIHPVSPTTMRSLGIASGQHHAQPKANPIPPKMTCQDCTLTLMYGSPAVLGSRVSVPRDLRSAVEMWGNVFRAQGTNRLQDKVREVRNRLLGNDKFKYDGDNQDMQETADADVTVEELGW